MTLRQKSYPKERTRVLCRPSQDNVAILFHLQGSLKYEGRFLGTTQSVLKIILSHICFVISKQEAFFLSNPAKLNLNFVKL